MDVELSKLKVNELKQLLKDKGLAVSGNKAELIARLQDDQQHKENTEDAEQTLENVEDESLNVEEEDSLLDDSLPDTTTKANGTKVQEEDTEEPPKKIVKLAATSKENQPTSTVNQEDATSKTTDPIEKRKERFGDVDSDSKKLERAARFGVPVKSNTDDIKKQRAERFGTSSITSPPQGDTDEKLKKRADRFGLPSNTSSASTAAIAPAASSEKLKQRADRFGISVTSEVKADPEALKKRAERFGAVVSSKLSESEDKEKLSKRKERFGAVISSTKILDAEELKKKRAERFQTST